MYLIVMGTGMPVPAFACPLAKNLMPTMPVPEDLQKGQMPVCPCTQNSQKYISGMGKAVPKKFEKGHAKNARARKMCAHSHH